MLSLPGVVEGRPWEIPAARVIKITKRKYMVKCIAVDKLVAFREVRWVLYNCRMGHRSRNLALIGTHDSALYPRHYPGHVLSIFVICP